MQRAIEETAQGILQELAADPVLGRFVDSELPIPQPFRGSGPIKLVVLGQDPTVKRASERAKIRVVLNLDRGGNLRRYVTRICEGLGLELDRHVYATNYVKNFFVRPPTQIKGKDLLGAASRWWLPLLLDELAPFAGVPVIALGQPLLGLLTTGETSRLVRDYWGYRRGWQSGAKGAFRSLGPAQNRLGRVVFPFPHQPSVGKAFYREHMGDYIAFVRRIAGFG
jgi:hypothetical protein